MRDVAKRSEFSVMVVAGEASSDEHAAAHVRSLRDRLPELNVFGMGGGALRAARVETIVDSEHAGGVMGLTEVLGSLGRILSARRTLIHAAEARQPRLVILVDYPDFNLSLARVLRQRGHRIVYFISPQLWAWRTGRIRRVKRDIDAVISIFPFEVEFYRKFGVTAHFVGHPFLDQPEPVVDRTRFLTAVGLNPAEPVVALLPGSRKAEVSRLLPVMCDAMCRIRKHHASIQGCIPVAPTLDPLLIRKFVGDVRGIAVLPPGSPHGHIRELLRVSDAALVASGTATIHATIAEVPFAVVYRLSPLSYLVGRLLVRGIEFFAMPNLIVNEPIVTELLQSRVTGERLAAELHALLHDAPLRERVKRNLRRVRSLLRVPEESGITAAERAARIVLPMIVGGELSRIPVEAQEEVAS